MPPSCRDGECHVMQILQWLEKDGAIGTSKGLCNLRTRTQSKGQVPCLLPQLQGRSGRGHQMWKGRSPWTWYRVLGCFYKTPQTRGLISNRHVLLVVLEAWRPRLVLVWSGGPLPGHRFLSPPICMDGRATGALGVSFIRALIPVGRAQAHPHVLTPPGAHLLTPPPRHLGCEHVKLGGRSQHTSTPACRTGLSQEGERRWLYLSVAITLHRLIQTLQFFKIRHPIPPKSAKNRTAQPTHPVRGGWLNSLATTDLSDVLQSGENKMKQQVFKKSVFRKEGSTPAQVGCMRQALGPGALGRPRGSRWRGRREGGSGWETHVNPWLIHVNVWQNSLQKKKKDNRP